MDWPYELTSGYIICAPILYTSVYSVYTCIQVYTSVYNPLL